MTLEDIRNFVAIAQAGSLVRAAQRLGLSQPTLSKSIARLERTLRAQLVERHARGVRLTETGEVFLAHARKLDLGLQESLTAMRDLRQGVAGSVRFGVGMGVPQTLIAAACKPLLAHRRLTLEISGGMSDSLFQAVASGDTEFAITGVRPPESANLTWMPLFRDPMVPIATREHRLANARRVTWQELARERWIVANVGTITRAWFDQQFKRRGIEPPARLIGLRGYPPALELGAALSAISLLPASFVRASPDVSQYCELRKPTDWRSDRTVGILYRPNGYLSAAARAVMESIATTSRKLFREGAQSPDSLRDSTSFDC